MLGHLLAMNHLMIAVPSPSCCWKLVDSRRLGNDHESPCREFRLREARGVGLTPLHAFIGPNDSGKSTLLRALLWCERMRRYHQTHLRDWVGKEGFPVRPGSTVSFDTPDDGVGSDSRTTVRQTETIAELTGSLPAKETVLLRFDPDALRKPSPLIFSDKPLEFLDERGLGLASVYDAVFTRNLDGLIAIREHVRELFPTLKDIGFPPHSDNKKVIQATLKDGTVVPAVGMSEGLLYFLALAVLPYLDRVGTILLEEPENGLHPARIADVVRVLREVSRTTQVIVATHSPLVVNEIEPGEVTVVTRDPEQGTRVTPIANTPEFDERFKIYQLGELWLSYSDGETEKALLQGGPLPRSRFTSSVKACSSSAVGQEIRGTMETSTNPIASQSPV